MADKKISQLTAATTPLAGTEVLPIVQSGNTVKVSVANVTAGRAVSAQSFSADNTGLATPVGNFQSGDQAGARVAVVNSGAGGQTYHLVTGNPGIGNSGFALYDATNNATRLYVGSSTGNLTLNTGNVVMSTAGKGIDFSANANAPGMTSELLNWYEEGTFTPTFTGFTVGNGSVFGFYRRIGKQVFVTYGFILGSTSAVAALTGVSGFPFTTGSVGASRFFPVSGVAFESGVGWYGATSAIFTSATSGIGIFSPTNDVGFSATVPFTWGTDDSLSLSATYFVD